MSVSLEPHVCGVPTLPHGLHEMVDLRFLQCIVRIGSLHSLFDLFVAFSSLGQVHNKVMHPGHDGEEGKVDRGGSN